MTITMGQTRAPFRGGWGEMMGDDEGLKGAKMAGLCQETPDVQLLPMLVSAAEQKSRPEREWRQDWGGIDAGTGQGGMFRGNVYL